MFVKEFWTIRGWGFVVGACVFIFAAHMFYGANTNALSMIFAAAAYILCGLAFALTFRVESNEFLVRHRVLMLLFLFILVAGFLQLTPFGIGGPHPLWLNLDGPSAVTLDRDATQRALRHFGAVGAVFLFGAALAADSRRARLFFQVLMIAIAAYSIWAFAAFMLDTGALYGVERPYHRGRLAASFLSANSAATLFGTFGVLAMAEILQALRYRDGRAATRAAIIEIRLRRAALPVIALAFAMTCLALTASRAGIAVSGAALLILIGWELLGNNHRRLSWRVPAAVAAISAGALLTVTMLSGELAVSRFGEIETTLSGRTQLFEAHWGAFKQAPWSGQGLGTFHVINQLIQTSNNWQNLNFSGATHNVFIQALEEGGVLIALPLFALVGLILIQIFYGIGRRRRMAGRLRAILIFGFVVIGHGTVDYALEVPSIALYWALLLGVGAGLAVARSKSRSPR